ncbi:8-amino-7-oxononanoate synthase [Pseudoalteromonas denitrificans]|uniref:8-amino-7-oxononanoate synthase n=1 Tax=Pseudoalteromonas denitrificans DSM 6059 TaxID=1123010 RepID=A0A1I1SSX5_9GAMM|nr:8-amino-7-oxononanoate synthase [Pseudoalteromonas denitrificans]SFD47003.1 8-amino-7-oxononanoate synthase [Pseudoalteromonas denitrificans DSM 6059]
MAFEYISDEISQRKSQSLFRVRYVIEQSDSRFIRVNGKSYLNFASNDYLSLNAPLKYALNSKIGSTSSALVTGYHQSHQDLERYLTNLMGYQACLLFSSGFSANASVLKTLMSDADSEIFQDKLNHASLIDGGLASNAAMVRFKHNDLTHLSLRLNKSSAKNKLIVSEGVFSMDGDSAPIESLMALAKKHDAWLMIDDAHGFGIRGKQGLGSCEIDKPELLVLTFGKAIASSGACILCSEQVKEYLLQFNREYIFSTAMAPLMAKVTHDAIKNLMASDEKRLQLTHNINYFRKQFEQLCSSSTLMCSTSAIQPILIGDAQKALDISEKIKKENIWLTAIRPPTVPKNTARLRITITAAHQKNDIDKLVNILSKVL